LSGSPRRFGAPDAAAELFMIYLIMAAVLNVSARGPVYARDGKANLMKQWMHPLVTILLESSTTLFGRVLPTWTLSLATIAGLQCPDRAWHRDPGAHWQRVVRPGPILRGSGYGVALIANSWAITDAVAQMLIGAVCGGLLGLVVGPLIARYSGIFFGM